MKNIKAYLLLFLLNSAPIFGVNFTPEQIKSMAKVKIGFATVNTLLKNNVVIGTQFDCYLKNNRIDIPYDQILDWLRAIQIYAPNKIAVSEFVTIEHIDPFNHEEYIKQIKNILISALENLKNSVHR